MVSEVAKSFEMDSVRYTLLTLDMSEHIEGFAGVIKDLPLLGITVEDSPTFEVLVERIEVQELTLTNARINTVTDSNVSSESL